MKAKKDAAERERGGDQLVLGREKEGEAKWSLCKSLFAETGVVFAPWLKRFVPSYG